MSSYVKSETFNLRVSQLEAERDQWKAVAELLEVALLGCTKRLQLYIQEQLGGEITVEAPSALTNSQAIAGALEKLNELRK